MCYWSQTLGKWHKKIESEGPNWGLWKADAKKYSSLRFSLKRTLKTPSSYHASTSNHHAIRTYVGMMLIGTLGTGFVRFIRGRKWMSKKLGCQKTDLKRNERFFAAKTEVLSSSTGEVRFCCKCEAVVRGGQRYGKSDWKVWKGIRSQCIKWLCGWLPVYFITYTSVDNLWAAHDMQLLGKLITHLLANCCTKTAIVTPTTVIALTIVCSLLY